MRIFEHRLANHTRLYWFSFGFSSILRLSEITWKFENIMISGKNGTSEKFEISILSGKFRGYGGDPEIRKYHDIQEKRDIREIPIFHVIWEKGDIWNFGATEELRKFENIMISGKSRTSEKFRISILSLKNRHVKMLELAFVVSCDIRSITTGTLASTMTATLKIM